MSKYTGFYMPCLKSKEIVVASVDNGLFGFGLLIPDILDFYLCIFLDA